MLDPTAETGEAQRETETGGEVREILAGNLRGILRENRAPERKSRDPVGLAGGQTHMELDEAPVICWKKGDEIKTRPVDQTIWETTDGGGTRVAHQAEPLAVQLAKLAAEEGAEPDWMGHHYTEVYTTGLEDRRGDTFFSGGGPVEYAKIAPSVLNALARRDPSFGGKTLVEIGQALIAQGTESK